MTKLTRALFGCIVCLFLFVFGGVTRVHATSFSFSSTGDYGTGTAFRNNITKIKDLNDSFHVAVGDFAYGGDPTSWGNTIKGILGTSYPFQLVAGNHDAYNGTSQWNAYTTSLPNKMTLPTPPSSICQYADPLPLVGGSAVCQQYGSQYYFDYPTANPIARIIGISPGGNVFNWHYTVGTNHYNWTAAVIDDARAKGIPWVIVGMHQTCLSTGTKSCAFTSGTEPDVMNLLINKRVDLVVQGHDHDYQRSKQLSCAVVNSYSSSCVANATSPYVKGAGTVFVINGLGGVSQYNISTGDSENGYFSAWSGANINPSYGISYFTVSDNPMQLTEQYIPTSGTFTDNFTITAGSVTLPTNTPIISNPTPTRTPTPTAIRTPTPTSTPPTRTPTVIRTPTPTPGVIPAYPVWWNEAPVNLRNFLEQLYVLVYYFLRPSNMQYLLDGVFPAPTPSP